MVLSAKNRDPITQDSYPRATINHNSCSSEKNRYHLYGHHHNQFEEGTFSSLSLKSNLGESFKKRQHFVHGRPPCGSSDNYLTYGGMPAPAPKVNSRRSNAITSGDDYNEADMHGNSREKSSGFLYGEHDSEVGQPLPRKMKGKDVLPPWMMDKTSAELRKREIQSLEIEEDLARSRLEKANQKAQYIAEQKKDLEMLQGYKPWGKPGGGAPRGVENDRTSTIRTRKIEQLITDNDQVLPFGKPGAGAPNRTDSGNIKTKLSSDTHIQLRAHRDGRPVDFISVKNGDTDQYRTELDKLAEETRYRRHKEKEEDFQHDLETLKYDPFGRPGGGAPLIGEHGSPRAGLPLHFSHHMQELRSTEPKHPHAYSGSTGSNNPLLPRQDFVEVEKHHKIKKKDSDDELDQGFQFGMPGAGAPIRDKHGRVLAHGRHTLIKDRSGALVKSPTKSNEAYYPFGRPGGGAPIRDNRGRVRAHVAGIVENEKIGKIGGKNEEGIEAQKGYLETLRRMQEERESQKFKEKSDLLESASSTSDWLGRGLVGRPKYDPYTHEIKADPMMTSDVTRQRMNIQTQASEKSRIYHHELDEIVKEREKQRMRESVQQREQSAEHAKTMERAWGRPGYGAPNAERKKAKMDMMPADHGSKWRDD